ncbi:hypothetical protein M0D21_08230 [Aquimarina sp. D1M17]|uniref:hypothetical protein n=1 Tax=Aquimarina acroporae TaxID=2937283 RepID=UPI0020C08EC8|nr:hypothetical protein [Aquimarina acroporae]MCK8521552.1 hypothetical protein [Aquimarina acroporae]
MMAGILIWMTLVGILGDFGFYTVDNVSPPRFIFLLGPGILFVLLLFLSRKGRHFSNQLDLKWLTLLHIVRIPVEIVLYHVFLAGYIPDLMTFEGYNYDILSGFSALPIYYAVFIKNWIGRKGLLIWNFTCLGLLINILTIAVLSAQTPLQTLAFDQPNIGVTYFPFVWLPALIVPIVFYSHLSSIFQLLRIKDKKIPIYHKKR